mmetsp:Transcript_6109/g.17161  ORF Transcript_6109/g.17161 Transcript_6109/m.17161 type:complete len:297 (+) Transcript_6109:1530-2420(+)
MNPIEQTSHQGCHDNDHNLRDGNTHPMNAIHTGLLDGPQIPHHDSSLARCVGEHVRGSSFLFVERHLRIEPTTAVLHGPLRMARLQSRTLHVDRFDRHHDGQTKQAPQQPRLGFEQQGHFGHDQILTGEIATVRESFPQDPGNASVRESIELATFGGVGKNDGAQFGTINFVGLGVENVIVLGKGLANFFVDGFTGGHRVATTALFRLQGGGRQEDFVSNGIAIDRVNGNDIVRVVVVVVLFWAVVCRVLVVLFVFIVVLFVVVLVVVLFRLTITAVLIFFLLPDKLVHGRLSLHQ